MNTSGAVVLLLLCLVGVLALIRSFNRKLGRERWRRFARDRECVFVSEKPFGYLAGSRGGRHWTISMASHRDEGCENLLSGGLRVALSLHPMMKPLHFRRERARDRTFLFGLAESEIGDDSLDSFLQLMGTDETRYRQLLSDSRARELVIRAHQSNGATIRVGKSTYQQRGVLVVRDGHLHLARQVYMRDQEAVDALLEEAFELTEALERADGIGWVRAADAFDLALNRDAGEWTLCSQKDQARILCRYWTGPSPRTCVTIHLSGPHQSLRLGDIAPDSPGLRSGDPIVDSNIHISGVSQNQIRMWAQHDSFTECVMNVIKGLSGRVEDGCIEIEQAGLIADPSAVIADAMALADIIESAHSPQPAEV